jgi:hypothetical protein
VNRTVIDDMYSYLGINNEYDKFFDNADMDGDSCITILDIKRHLSFLGPPAAKLNLFMKDMKKMFRTSYINKITFTKIFTLYEDVTIYKDAMTKLKDLFYNPSTAQKAGDVDYCLIETLLKNTKKLRPVTKEELLPGLKALIQGAPDNVLNEIASDIGACNVQSQEQLTASIIQTAMDRRQTGDILGIGSLLATQLYKTQDSELITQSMSQQLRSVFKSIH